MQKYKYTALNLQKQKINGTFIAEDEKDLARQLARQGLYVTSCSVYSGGTPSAFFTLGTGKVSVQELTTFCRQFAIMITAGISVLECLECLKEQAFTKYFKNLLQVVYEDVKTGVMLSDAFNKHNDVFPDFFRSMVYVGEVSGNLEKVFESLADYYERDSDIKRKTKSAFSYPIMLLCLTIGLVALMLLYVVPTFRESLASLNIVPTGITKVVYDISDFLLSNWLYALAIIVVIAAAAYFFGKTTTGKVFYDTLKLRVPLLKNITIDLIAARFARGFALLLTSGVDIVDALDSIQIVLGNREFEARFKKAKEEVKHGSKLAESFEKYKLFPPILLQMITIGERTASLDEVLNRSCGFFDTQFETTLNSVTSKIQPIMLLIMGVAIGVMFIAIYSPMLEIMTNLI